LYGRNGYFSFSFIVIKERWKQLLILSFLGVVSGDTRDVEELERRIKDLNEGKTKLIPFTKEMQKELFGDLI